MRRRPPRPVATCLVALHACAAGALVSAAPLASPLASPLAAQGVLDRTPNVDDGWTLRPGHVQFNFLHRFTVSDAPARKVTSFPTFLLATGLPAELAFGIRYATNSAVFERIPNEHELWLRKGLVRQERGAPLDAAATVAYNSAAQSGDGELVLARRFGPLRLLGATRVLSSAFDTDRTLWGAGGGAVLRLTSWLSVAGDAFTLLNEGDEDDFDPAWGVAAQIGIPFSPHTLSIQVVNTNTASIQGSSIGFEDEVTVGFEFTIPITPARWFGGTEPTAVADSGARAAPPVPPAETAAETVAVRIADLAFEPSELRVRRGTAVRWVNDDTLEHTVTAEGGGFDSGLLAPGAMYERTFVDAGTFAYQCRPHPSMRGRVIVE